MTFKELLDQVSKIEGVAVRFKRIEHRLILIFWKGHSPIAHVYVDAYEYNKDYPKLFEMNLYDMLELDQLLYDFTQTPLEERELP